MSLLSESRQASLPDCSPDHPSDCAQDIFCAIRTACVRSPWSLAVRHAVPYERQAHNFRSQQVPISLEKMEGLLPEETVGREEDSDCWCPVEDPRNGALHQP